MTLISVIGVDPGPTTGLCFLDYEDKRLKASLRLQVNGDAAVFTLETILMRAYNDPEAIPKRFAQLEPFVTGNSAGTKMSPGETTRQLAFALGETLLVYGYHVARRKAADIKSWGSDKRLEAAGIMGPKEGMRHANDAGRHALYAAVHDAYRPDPLR